METQYLKNIADFIAKLLPNVSITNKKRKEDKLNVFGEKRGIICNNGKKVASKFNGNKFYIYLQSIARTEIHEMKVYKETGFSRNEKKLLKTIQKAIRSTNITSANFLVYQPQIIEAGLSFPYFVISQLMRGKCEHNWGAPIHYLQLLQNLTFQRYENQKCTSGFVCVANVREFLSSLENKEVYKYIPFKKIIHITSSFFSKPAAYRYVDGRNSFYLCSRSEQVHGILTLNNPNQYNILERCSGEYLQDILSIEYCKWVSYIGYSNDVVLYAHNFPQLKWENNYWRLRDKEQLKEILVEQIKTEKLFADNITKTILTLSELHMGSLILITDGGIPETISKIDTTPLGKELYEGIYSASYRDLIDSNRILGLLSSDGLTVFNTKGIVIDCGSIINLSSENKSSIAGGGRTQAAIIASLYGIAIKVSEDGPITVYKNGECILKL